MKVNLVRSMDFRDNLSENVNRVSYGKDRVLLTRRGKPICAVISMEDFNKLSELEKDPGVIEKELDRITYEMFRKMEKGAV